MRKFISLIIGLILLSGTLGWAQTGTGRGGGRTGTIVGGVFAQLFLNPWSFDPACPSGVYFFYAFDDGGTPKLKQCIDGTITVVGSGAATVTLDNAFDDGKIIDGANSLVNAFRFGGDATAKQWCAYHTDAAGLIIEACTATNQRNRIPTDKTGGWFDVEGDSDMAVYDPDGTGFPYHQWGPKDNDPPASNFATLDTRNDRPVLDFDAAADEFAVFSGVIHRGYAGNTMKVLLTYMMTSATTNEILWCAQWEYLAEGGDATSDSFDTAVCSGDVTVPGTAGLTDTVTLAFTKTAADEIIAGGVFRLKIYRDADSTSTGTDDAAGDAELLRVQVVYIQ